MVDRQSQNNGKQQAEASGAPFRTPSISLPEGGGAIHGMGEKFAANPATGTASMAVPIATSPGRAGFGPQLSLSYDSGAGNGPFGFGWSLTLPSIARKTERGLPQYQDAVESDVFILSGAEDLVPALVQNGEKWERGSVPPRKVGSNTYRVSRYRPRIEGLFARIERWTNQADPNDSFWHSISRDNISAWYGKTAESRITDPQDPARIFSWLICESYDDKGNCMAYAYKAENSDAIDISQAHERNRTDETRATNRYLKRITYGNRTPYYPILAENQPPTPLPSDWLFEAVLDYGEHDPDIPMPGEQGKTWTCRNDPFSTYRPAFEVRTYRLCQRVLVFHHFPNEPDLGVECLVRSTEFTYSYEEDPPSAQNPIFSHLLSVTQSGYKRQGDAYLKKSLPFLEFDYSQPTIDQTIHEVDPESLENLPQGFDGARYQWVDLDGEGLSGILNEQGGGWFYKPNLSPAKAPGKDSGATLTARFGPVEQVAQKPSLAAIGGGRPQFFDLAGDGQLDLVELRGPNPGFYERTGDKGWQPFIPFDFLPVLNWDDPNLKFVDLTGDGHADILITRDQAFSWYPSLAEAGFGSTEKAVQALNEENGPKLVFADGTQSVYLADMSGDGLTDLVRILNGEICYWPNLGYGRFGAKVTMDNAPWFDHPDEFDQRRVRLADIDGSGVTDIIYLAPDGVDVYFNQSGNSWSKAQRLSAYPKVDDIAAVQAVDLMGNATACLVWSSPLPGDAERPMRYMDLMGGQKPHLLLKSVNNLGAETCIFYAPSTKFYVADKLAGKPWITRIPFPVHVLERLETYDRISGNRFVTRYAYHHGYFDGVEREFRGFGLVEQWDTEEYAALSGSQGFPPSTNIDASSYVPPVLTRTWFHTGVYLGREAVSNYFAGLLNATDADEYYREPGMGDAEAQALLLPDTVLPDGLSLEEERQACRALKGAMLRKEVYALDGTSKESRPYLVTEQNFTIRTLQPQAGNRYGVFFTHPREALSFRYERDPADPRVGHALTLAVDDYGNVLKSAAIGYGRRLADNTLSVEDQAKQTQTLITFSENAFTQAIQLDDDYRAPLPAETRSYELTGLKTQSGKSIFAFEEVLAAISEASPLSYEQAPAAGLLQKRLVKHHFTMYRPNDLGAASGDSLALLPAGILESRALPGESYSLAFTVGLLPQVYGERVNPDVLRQGGYVQIPGDDGWWLPTGRMFYSPNSGDASSQELKVALAHFFVPVRFRDPFDNVATVSQDIYDLLAAETQDPIGNTVIAVNDYRVLQPRLLTDPNGNRSEVAFDALGMVVGTAVMGKPGENFGDTLVGFESDLPDSVVQDHLEHPLNHPHAVLQSATTRLVYDPFAYSRTHSEVQPQAAVVYALARETHQGDLQPGEHTKVQHGFSYFDGFGREIQKKIQAEPGPVTEGGFDINPRWVGSGWTIFNNKGKPVQRFEPFFAGTHRFEFDVRQGVGPILCYDPLLRVVATLDPNHTWQKVIFDPWRQETWDVNDAVLIGNPADDPDIGALFGRLPEADYLPTWYGQRVSGALGLQEQAAATKAAIHAETPMLAHLDTLGRTFLTIAHNKLKRSDSPPGEPPEETFQHTRVALDIEGNQREVLDAMDRVVMRCDYDMLSQQAHSVSMDAGDRWLLNDVAGKPIRAWDNRGHALRTEYDALRRPVGRFVIGTDAAQSDPRVMGREVMFEKIEYGEGQPNDAALNLRTRIRKAYDAAGVLSSESYDFKGNLLRGSRQLASDYKSVPAWSGEVTLERETFSSSTAYDALNRPITKTASDGSVIRPTFNEANLLERIDINLHGETSDGAPVWTAFVADIDYNAKGQRELIVYGNGVRTQYAYDPLTFRLVHLLTSRDATAYPNDCPSPPTSAWAGCAVQNLSYNYDPAGNITQIQDDAQQTIFFRNQRVAPGNDYTYDALYQLIGAEGREHLGQNGPIPPDAFDAFHTGLLPPGDGNAMGRYFESYIYDVAGNILAVQHRGTDPSNPGWRRSCAYLAPSLIEPSKVSNRLSSTQAGNSPLERYSYDAGGSMTAMPHLPVVEWSFLDQLRTSSTQVVNDGKPETTYYVYDSAGRRMRKITERPAAAGDTPRRMKERIYLGGFEIYREYGGNGDGIVLERETLHVMDGKQRVAMVETRTFGDDGTASRLIRYQVSNHLGSASAELDEFARIISYEEYFPYGSTSYQAVDSSLKAAAKRYRYTGKERDDETGLAYHEARYYAHWLGRWTSVDPAGLRESLNVYTFVLNNPARLTDNLGLGTDSTQTWSDYFASYLSPEAWRQSLNQTAHDLVPMMPAWDALNTTIGGRYVDPNESIQATFDSTWNNIASVVQFAGAGLSPGDVGIGEVLEHLPLLGEHLPAIGISLPATAERAPVATEELTFSAKKYTGPSTVGFWDEGASLTASSKSTDLSITISTVGRIESEVKPPPGVTLKYQDLGNTAGELARQVGQAQYMFPSLSLDINSLLARAGFTRGITYNPGRFEMTLNTVLRAGEKAAERYGTIAHENYHYWTAVNRPTLAYVSDYGLPVLRTYANVIEEWGAYTAGNTPFLARPVGVASSVIGKQGINAIPEALTPPVGLAGVGFGGYEYYNRTSK